MFGHEKSIKVQQKMERSDLESIKVQPKQNIKVHEKHGAQRLSRGVRGAAAPQLPKKYTRL